SGDSVTTVKRSGPDGHPLSTTRFERSGKSDHCAGCNSRSIQRSDNGSSVDVSTILNPDGSTTTLTVTTFPDGSQTIETVTTSEPFGSLSHSTDTTVVAVSSDGSQGVVSHTLDEGGTDSDTGASWGHTEETLFADGETTSTSTAWTLDASGNLSSTK